jgi:lysyl-tRNA synthetase class 1
MDELDELENEFFRKKRTTELTDKSKLAGLYRYCWGLNPPEGPDVHIPYNLLVRLAKVAPKGSEMNFIKEKLLSYGYSADVKTVESRICYALNWVKDFKEVEGRKITLSEVEIKAVAEFITILEREEDVDAVQGAIFQTARKYKLKPRKFFEILYTALLGVPRGPRLGPYVVDVGKQNVIKALKKFI